MLHWRSWKPKSWWALSQSCSRRGSENLERKSSVIHQQGAKQRHPWASPLLVLTCVELLPGICAVCCSKGKGRENTGARGLRGIGKPSMVCRLVWAKGDPWRVFHDPSCHPWSSLTSPKPPFPTAWAHPVSPDGSHMSRLPWRHRSHHTEIPYTTRARSTAPATPYGYYLCLILKAWIFPPLHTTRHLSPDSNVQWTADALLYKSHYNLKHI